MNSRLVASLALLFLALNIPLVGQEKDKKAETKAVTPKAIKFSDTKLWERVGQFTISPNGKWTGHVVMPGEGDGRLIIAERNGEKK